MKIFKLIITLIVFIGISVEANSSTLINLTKKEKQFIKNHPQIVLGVNKGWDPSVIVNDDGTYSGIDNEILNLFNKISGANFILKADDWSKILQQAKDKEIDGLTTSAVFKQREKYFNFSKSYINIQKLIITTKENPSGIQNIKDLDGKTIGVHKSNLLDNKIANRFIKSKIVKYKTYKELIMSVSMGHVDAVIGSLAVPYSATKMNIPNLKATVGLDEVINLVFSVRKDYSEAIGIINKCLDYIGKEKLLAIKNKWYLNTPHTTYNFKQKLSLTSKENNYLLNKKTISMCIDPNWLPFEAFDKNGNHIGISADIFDEFRKQISANIEVVKTKSWTQNLQYIKDKKCDILSLAMKIPSREKYMNFTSTYLKLPIVLATKLDKPFIDNFELLTTQKIGIVKDYASRKILEDNYPNLNLVEVEDLTDGLNQVVKGKLFGYIGALSTIGYYIQKDFTGDIKIAGKFKEQFELSIAVRDDDKILLGIFEKLIQNMDKKKKNEILNSWISIKYEKGVDYDLVWQILIVVFILSILFFYYQRKLRIINNTLEQRVQDELKLSHDKDKMLFQQNKLAAMGEMIANIAHQWRQPIATLNGIYLNMEMDYEDKKLDKKVFDNYLNQLENTTKYMSATIEDFTNFFKPNKIKENFNINDLLVKAKSMLEKYLKDSNITIDLELNDTISINSYPSELM